MNQLTIALLIIPMVYAFASTAQEKHSVTIEWKVAGELPSLNGSEKSPGFAGPVIGILNNMLLVAGGSNFPGDMPWKGGKKKYYSDVYLFSKKDDSLISNNRSFNLPVPVSYAASCTTPLGIVYAGGENESGASNKCWLLQYDTEKNSLIIKSLPDLPVALANASVAYYTNALYLAGGENSGGVSNKFYRLDVEGKGKEWKELPPLMHPVSHTVLLAQPDKIGPCIYLLGGRKKNNNSTSDLYREVYAFDITKNDWKEKSPLPFGLSAHSGLALSSHYVLIFGGDKGKTFHQSETLTAAINKEVDETRRKALIGQKATLQSSHPGFSNTILLYNTITDEWQEHSEIPFNVPVTTTAVLWGNDIIIPGGEIKAGVRTPLILMGKLPGK
jgi:N-acetylneuraminate epimerase